MLLQELLLLEPPLLTEVHLVLLIVSQQLQAIMLHFQGEHQFVINAFLILPKVLVLIFMEIVIIDLIW